MAKRGGRRKTARRAYTGLKTRAKNARSYVRRRRGAIRMAPKRRKSTSLVKTRAMGALKECGWFTAGGAAGLLATKYMPGQYASMSSTTILGASALAYGVAKNNPKAIYIGFGALYPRIQQQVARLVGA